ncbi:VanW family protein [Demequina sediminicola]|uniref:VanW family protein n=1 Tax=Demequina sediminicola TaxID=1095026 RepID=UPI0007838A8E|nr:VanW family protein [Demequina sediminicola]
MSRRKDAQLREVQAQVERRRRSAAHRSLRSRAARGKGGFIAGSTGPDVAPEAVVYERTPTAELATPTWLASETPTAPPLHDDKAEQAATDEDGATPADAGVGRVSFVAAAGAAHLARSHAGEDASVPEPEGQAEGQAEAENVPESDDAPTEVIAPVPASPNAGTPEDSETSEPAVEQTAVMAEPVPASDNSSAVESSAAESSAVESSSAAHEEPAEAEAVTEESPQRRGKGWIVGIAAIALLGVAYVGGAALLSNTVPRGTTALGVDIGGMSTGQAVGAVNEAADELVAQDLVISAGEATAQVPAGDAGLGVDAQSTVEATTGFTWRLDRMWSHIVGGGDLDVVTTVEDDALSAAIDGVARELDSEPADATVEIVGTVAVAEPGSTGIEVDADATAEIVVDQWPDSLDVEADAVVIEPAVTDGTAELFAREVTDVALAGPVTLVSDAGEVAVSAEDLAENASVESSGGALELVINGEPLAAQIVSAQPELETEPKDAKVSFDSSQKIQATAGVDGQSVDADNLGEALVEASFSASRSGELPVVTTEPAVRSEDLGVEDLKEVVASFDTPLTNEYVRTQNLITAAADVQGTTLLPGDQFNLAQTLAPITVEEGYAEAHVIVDGILTNGMGGGLSQMATTSYNAAYFAGFELLQHRPHSVWFERYPAGRESTLWGETINVVFENNTPYAAVMNSYVSNGRLYVEVWSTPHFEVETFASDKTNIRQPGVKEVTAEGCESKNAGHPGFTITNTRSVLLDGEEVDRNVDTWTYAPDDAIKCLSEEDEDD